MKPFSYDDLRLRLEHYQQTYAGMAGEHTDQADVDRVFNITSASEKPSLPKGLSAETLKLVEVTLRHRDPADGDLSAAEAAQLLGIFTSQRTSLPRAPQRPRAGRGHPALRRGRAPRAALRMALSTGPGLTTCPRPAAARPLDGRKPLGLVGLDGVVGALGLQRLRASP